MRSHKPELVFHVPERCAQIAIFAVELENRNGDRRVVIRYKMFVLDGVAEGSFSGKNLTIINFVIEYAEDTVGIVLRLKFSPDHGIIHECSSVGGDVSK